MPLYEYQCEACGHRFEKIQKFSDPPIEVCPTCGGKVHKLIASPAFQFKGTGWYITDYAKKDGGGTPKDKESKEGKDSKEKESSSPAKEGSASKSESSSSGDSSSSATSTTSKPAAKD